MCLYVQGAVVKSVFTPTANTSLIGKLCSTTSPNQLFSWKPSSQGGGQLINIASNQAVSVNMANTFYSRTRKPLDKFKVYVAAGNTGLNSVWYWTDSTLRSAVNPLYQVTSKKLRLNNGSSSSPIGMQKNGNTTITSAYMTGTSKPIWFWTATCVA
jgi:hypothetical protein